MSRTRSAGFTLTELLVAMAISIALVAVALPMVKFNLEEGKVREASRQVNAMLAKAKARAALNGLPVGVQFERDAADPNRVTNLYLAEVPALFIGSQENSRVIVNNSNQLDFVTDDGPMSTPSTQKDVNTLVLLDNMLTPNKSQARVATAFGIRFDFKGPIYVGMATPSGSTTPEDAWTFQLTSFPAPVVPRSAPRGYPFEFARPPQRLTNQHLELPKGTFVAMEASGLGASGSELASSTTEPVTVVFSAGGSFSSYYMGGNPVVPSAALHLLVGRMRNDQRLDPFNTATPPAPPIMLLPENDETSLWVSMGTASGTIRTADNAPLIPTVPSASAPPTRAQRLHYAREFAIKHDVKGR